MDTVNAIGIKATNWSFLVTVDSTYPGMLASGMEVKRRFSEFDVRLGFSLVPYPDDHSRLGRRVRLLRRLALGWLACLGSRVQG